MRRFQRFERRIQTCKVVFSNTPSIERIQPRPFRSESFLRRTSEDRDREDWLTGQTAQVNHAVGGGPATHGHHCFALNERLGDTPIRLTRIPASDVVLPKLAKVMGWLRT
jgi:hypothetical protein